MEKASLFEHNEIAYEKLCEVLEENRCATINHATGTGKSFIALKYLYNNRDKKFLYLAPTYPIIEQLKKDCYKIGITPQDINIDAMIYRNLLQLDMKELYKRYDGIIFDEYHRVGATKTYKKIKELKAYLTNDKDEKKFIGLTATPIRYLDRERNMTNEIFDGVVASTLPLSEAMVEGLLPIPYYINSKIACREQLGKMEKRIEKFAPGKPKEKLTAEANKISKKINNGYLDYTEMVNKYIQKKDGKYIVFCSTIDKLNDYYNAIDKWFEKFGSIKKYMVHSGKERSTNQEQLDKFNEDKEGISVLLCVDILNEGIHVDDIDGVFLLRKTVSPIIYFQQIGRALSFSGRNRQIKIFDLVNNFGNHNAIDLVYKEFLATIEQKMANEPEKADEYRLIKEKFKIKTETENILKHLNEIKNQTSAEEIYKSRINYSIEQLIKNIKNIESKNDIFENIDYKKNYLTISRYYKYINTEQFIKLQDLDLILPEELTMTLEERSIYLDGYDSIHEKEKNISKDLINNFQKFVMENGRNARINSENEYEKKIAMQYLYFLPQLEEKDLQTLLEAFEKNNIELKSYEKVIFNQEIRKNDVEDLIERANKYLDNNSGLPGYLKEAISCITNKYNTQLNVQLLDILDKNSEIIEKQIEEKNLKRYEKLKEILDYLKENITQSRDELEELGILSEIYNLSPKDLAYIKRKYEILKKEYYRTFIKNEDTKDMTEFCRFMKQLDNDTASDYLEKVETDKELYSIINDYVYFMLEHDGNMPDINSTDEIEKTIATEYEKLEQNGMIDKKLISYLSDDKSILLKKPERIIQNIAKMKYKELETKDIILKNVLFLLKNKRRPLINSQDKEEKDLAEQYNNKAIKELDVVQNDIMAKLFNKKQYLNNTCMQYIENSKNEERER